MIAQPLPANCPVISQSDFTRMVIGTAQLGFPYGIANKTGPPPDTEIRDMIRQAWEKGVRMFDTAQGYGESEARLGTALMQLGYAGDALVVTKFGGVMVQSGEADFKAHVENSLTKLNVSSLHGLMLHEEDLLDIFSDRLRPIMEALRDSGKIKHIGVSCYSPARAMQAMATPGIDFVQIPANLFDRRFHQCGVMREADIHRKTVYTRSVFLQGLLLMDPHSLPARMAFAQHPLIRLREFCTEHGVAPLGLAMAYVREKYPHARVIFGAESRVQVTENLMAWEMSMPQDLLQAAERTFKDLDDRIVNPARWPTK